MTRQVIAALLLCTAVSLLAALPAPLLVLCGAAQAFVLPGLAFVSLVGDRRRPWTDDLFYSLLLSPVLLTLSVLAAGRLGGGHAEAVTAAAWFWYLVFGISLLARRKRETPAASALPRGVVLLSLGYGGLVLASYLANDFLLWRSDAWYHASVTTEILERGYPPGEPWLAGVPIRYMWIYHLFLASWIRLSGLPVFWAMGALNVCSAACFPYVAGKYIATLTGVRRRILPATLLTTAGFESAAWILWPVSFGRAFFGEVRGMDAIARQVALAASQINDTRVIFFLSPYGTWMVNLSDKFLTVTAFSYSLCLLLVCLHVAGAREYRERAPLAAGLFACAAILGAFMFHAVTGALLVATVLGAGALAALGARREGFRGALPPGRIVLPAAALVAGALGLIYLIALGAVGGDGSHSAARHLLPNPRNMLTILLPLLPVAWPAWRAIRRMFPPADAARGVAGQWIACILLLCLFVDLPSPNESKLIFPLFLLLGPLVFLEALDMAAEARPARRLLLAAWLALLFFVPPVMTYRGFIISPPITDNDKQRAALSARDRELLSWIAENTAPDAVIAERGHNYLAPVFARRRNLSSRAGVINVLGYGGETIETYRAIQDSLFSTGAPGTDTIERIRGTRLDLYVLIRPRDEGEFPGIGARLGNHPDFEVVYEKQAHALLRFSGTP